MYMYTWLFKATILVIRVVVNIKGNVDLEAKKTPFSVLNAVRVLLVQVPEASKSH